MFVRNECRLRVQGCGARLGRAADVTVQAEDPESAAALFAQVRGALGLHW